MNYGPLSQKYFNEASVLKNYIKFLKKQYSDAKIDEDLQFKDRISTLYKMYLELTHTAKYLKRKQELMDRCREKFYH
ncbi:MAG: hypothetical protein Q4D57_05775 [Clostridia bacterium]|nr:hypothetical protein [Clostridia bacterium]